MSRTWRFGWTVVFVLLMVVLTAAVVSDWSRPLDIAARDALRPRDVWGSPQLWGGTVSTLLGPSTSATVLAVTAGAVAYRDRSWRPIGYAVLVAGGGGTVTLALKISLARTDPHGDLSSIGSYPSGHMAASVCCLGGAVMLGSARWPKVPAAVVVLAATALAWALLVQATHWLTDVMGGILIGLVVLTGSARTVRTAHRMRAPG